MLGIFGLGTAGYLPTEEGSATFFEVVLIIRFYFFKIFKFLFALLFVFLHKVFAGVSSPNVMRDYASRSLAVSFVHQGFFFN